MHDMLNFLSTFKWRLLAFLLLVLLHAAIPLHSAEDDLLGNAVTSIKESDAQALVKSIPKLKPAEWAKLPGTEIKIDAKVHKTDAKVTVGPDDVYIVIPHPTDQWTQGPEAKYTKATWKESELPLQWFIGDDSKLAYEGANVIIKGDGPLTLGHGDANAGDNWGFIRVKLVKVVKPPTKKPKK